MMHLVGAYAGIFCWGCSRNIYYYESDSITLYSTKNVAGGSRGRTQAPPGGVWGEAAEKFEVLHLL